MRIVIDLQGAQSESRFRGIGRYSLSLTQAIVRNRGEHQIIIVLSGLFPETIEHIRAAFDGLLPQENIRVWYAPGPVRECTPGNEWRREVAELIREAFIASLQPDVVLISSFFEGYIDDAVTSFGLFSSNINTVVILYDLIPLLNPESYLTPYPVYKNYYLRKIEYFKKADLWIAISGYSAQEGCDALGLNPSSVISVSPGCDAVFRPLEVPDTVAEKLLERFDIIKPFVLYSGGADMRKNLKRLIQAFALLPESLRNTHQLVLVGQIHRDKVIELRKEAKAIGVRDYQISFTGIVTDEELCWLYNLCTVFVFPSLHEGFGLPALEAMACGTAVIGSNTTSIPEVIGRDCALFDPKNEASIAQKLSQVLDDDSFRSKLVAEGLKQALKFSWEDSAKKIIAKISEKFVAKNSFQSVSNDFKLSQLLDLIALKVPFDITDRDILLLAFLLSCIPNQNRPKKLFVDISELVKQDERTGVQRVTRSILKELLNSPPKGYAVEPVYATINDIGYRYARSFISLFLGQSCDLEDDPIEYYPGDFFLGLDLQHHTTRVQVNFLEKMRRDGVNVYFVVYDLLPIHFPNCWPPEHSVHKVHQEWLYGISQLDGAVCISRAVANELEIWQEKHGPKRLRPFKICWFHLGADIENSVPTKGMPSDSNDVLSKIANSPSFLMVGTLEPRKRQAQTLAAFELLWKEGMLANLVIVGKQGWMVETLIEKLRKHSEYGKRLFWLEGISDEYLEKVYAASTCLIAASEGEGFGLPLIEAAQHRLPIIARDIPVFREVAGEHAYYFSGKNPGDLAQSITEWLRLHAAGKHPISDNMPWLTWKESASQLMQNLLGGDTQNFVPAPAKKN